MNFGKAESPDPAAYAAKSRLVTASADCRISVRRTLRATSGKLTKKEKNAKPIQRI